MKFTELALPGCFSIEPFCHRDARGIFLKTFQDHEYNEHGLDFWFREEFISVSHKKVLRGMHFQVPPAAHDKIVCCLKGEVFDAFVDLRQGSPTYRQSLALNLSERTHRILYLPAGIAHGFLTLSREAIMVYKTSTMHDPVCDTGIFWRGCGIEWPIDDPILSDRDRCFPRLNDFTSPFYYDPK